MDLPAFAVNKHDKHRRQETQETSQHEYFEISAQLYPHDAGDENRQCSADLIHGCDPSKRNFCSVGAKSLFGGTKRYWKCCNPSQTIKDGES